MEIGPEAQQLSAYEFGGQTTSAVCCLVFFSLFRFVVSAFFVSFCLAWPSVQLWRFWKIAGTGNCKRAFEGATGGCRMGLPFAFARFGRFLVLKGSQKATNLDIDIFKYSKPHDHMASTFSLVNQSKGLLIQGFLLKAALRVLSTRHMHMHSLFVLVLGSQDEYPWLIPSGAPIQFLEGTLHFSGNHPL